MDIGTASYAAFFDELAKIGEASVVPKPADPRDITRKKLIRLLKVVGAAGAGVAAGKGLGMLAGKLVKHPSTKGFLANHPKLRKALPMVTGGGAAATAMALATKDRKVKKYIEEADEAK